MGWDDKDSSDEDFDRAKEGFRELKERINTTREAERLWYEQVDNFIARPELLDEKTKPELDHLRIDAEGRIEGLESQSNSIGGVLSALTRGKGGSGFGDVLGGLNSAFASEKITKNRTLIRVIKAKEERDRVAVPEPSRTEQIIAEERKRAREREETIVGLRELRDDLKRKNPEQAEAIDQRFRKLIEATIEGE